MFVINIFLWRKLLIDEENLFMFGIFFRYLVNEGCCWFKYFFINYDFIVIGLVIELGGKIMRFSLWGFILFLREW